MRAVHCYGKLARTSARMRNGKPKWYMSTTCGIDAPVALLTQDVKHVSCVKCLRRRRYTLEQARAQAAALALGGSS